MPDDNNESSSGFFRAAFMAIRDAACILEPISDDDGNPADWRYLAVNAALEHAFEIEKATGSTLRERFPDVAEIWSAEFSRVMATGKAETMIWKEQSQARVYEVTLSPLAFGERRAVMAVISDVTRGHADSEGRQDAVTRYKTLLEAIDEAFCIVQVLFDEGGRGIDYEFLEANAAFVEHTGFAEPVGKRATELQPDLEGHWAEIYGRVASSGVAERFESESPAMGRWFDVSAFPIGKTAPFLVGLLFEDVGPRNEMELALRHSESRLHSLIKASSDLIFQMNPDGTEMRQVDRGRVRGFIGQSRNWVEDFIPESDRAEIKQAFQKAIKQRKPIEMQHRFCTPDGKTGWLSSRAVPVLGDNGEITQWFGMATDITARHEAEEQLAHSAQVLRVAVEIGKVGLWDWNVETGEVVWSDEHFRMQGYDVGEVTPSYEKWIERVHSEDRAPSEARLAQVMETGDDYIVDYRAVHPNGQIRWLSVRGRFLYDKNNKPVRMLGAMVDITERRHQEEWHKLLVAELQHRVRNLIGMVRSVARLSAPSHRNVDEYVDHLIGRLQAMGRTQSTLTRSPGRNVDLSELVREELLVHAVRHDQCFVEGPDVALSPHAAEIITLAIHELATNSVKYGALGDTGYIRITWNTEGRDGKTWVSFRWQETAPVRKTKKPRKGFGRRLIEERVPYELHGEGQFTVHDTGVLAQLDFPLLEAPSIFETRSY
jgi:PAS domain S-box-containing protein